MANQDLIIKIKSDVSNFSLSQLKNELKSTQSELDRLRSSGQQNTQAWNDLKTKANVLTGEIRSLNREYKGLDGQVKMSTQQFLEMGENITTVARGLYDVVKGLKDFGSELVNKGAELNVLKSGFKGSAQDLEALRKAAAGTITDANLMKLSNQAGLLNINLQDQARILGFVEERFDLFGGNVEEGFNKFLNAVQGGTRGLRSLRLDTEQYNQNLKSLVQSLGGVVEEEKNDNGEKEIKIKNLPAEIQMQLRLQAALQLLNYSYADSQNKTKDLRDKTEALKVASENAKASIGEGLAKALFGLADALGLTSDKANTTIGTVTVLGSQLLALLPIIAQLKIAFPAMATGAAASMGGLVGVIIAAGVAMASLENLISNYIPFSFTNNVGIGFENYLDKQRKKIEEDAIKEAERMNNDPKEFNAANSKGAKLVNGEWVKLTEADVKASDQKIATLKAIEEATKKTTNTKTTGHKQNLKELKEEEDAVDKLIAEKKQELQILEKTYNLTDDNLAKIQTELRKEREKIDLSKASFEEKQKWLALKQEEDNIDNIYIDKTNKAYQKDQENIRLKTESLKEQARILQEISKLTESVFDLNRNITSNILELSGDDYALKKFNIFKDAERFFKKQDADENDFIENWKKLAKEKGFDEDTIKFVLERFFSEFNKETKHQLESIQKKLEAVDPLSFKDITLTDDENNLIGYFDKSQKASKKYVDYLELYLKKLERDKFVIKLEAGGSGILDVANQFVSILGFGADTFVSKFLTGLNQAINLANSIVTLLISFGANMGSGGLFGFIGKIFGFAEGGLFTGAGSGTSDSNLIRISNGEFIVNSQATRQWLPLLQAINGNRVSSYGAYANGGLVRSSISQPIYIMGAMDGQTFFRVNEPKYRKNQTYLKIK